MAESARHFREIDGLRAIAVTLVLMFHAAPLKIPFGWIGVWLFFVISGFVITLSLEGRRDEARGWKASIAGFYSRRAFRILPLYVLIVALGAIVTAISGGLHEQFWPQLAALATFTFNFYRMAPGFEHSLMFGHLWSLSAEEQFYLLFPLLYFFLPRRRLLPALALVVIGAMAIRAGMAWGLGAATPVAAGLDVAAQRANTIYMFSPAHFDAFAVGAMLALAKDWVKREGWLLPAMLGATAIGWILLFAGWRTPAPDPYFASPLGTSASSDAVDVLRYTLLVSSAACIIVAVIQRQRIVTLLLGQPWLTYVGRVSFGMYIYHFPVLLFLLTFVFTPDTSRLTVFLSCLSVSLAIAALSFHAFEQPVQRLGARWMRRGIAMPVSAAVPP